MPKPRLYKEYVGMESDMIDTMVAGLQRWRPDLNYPESHSDFQACVRGLLQKYEIKLRPLPEFLKIECTQCDGIGELIQPGSTTFARTCERCTNCKGRGYTEGT